ncbi:MAG: Hsp20/alpha crystallin family protein [Halanaeroarchaeum sp.]
MTRDTTALHAAKQVGTTLVDTVGRVASRFHEISPLRADVLESPEDFLVVFDAPGTTVSDVTVSLTDHVVRVKIDRFRHAHEGFELRFPGRGLSLDGHAQLPEHASLDPAGASATLHDDGTLTVTIPKSADVSSESSGHDERDTTE